MAKRRGREITTRNLPVKLTAEELDQRRDSLANLHQECDVLEGKKSDANKAFNDALKKLGANMSLAAKEIRERAEYRDVEVKWVRNIEAGLNELVRQDSGEIVDSEALGPDDMQETIPGTH